ncbi:GNAT family N-acetyltransferase [uncultured Roseobacter sp.]|uniref:GNAT family N-acetyltransferase n=1 Tax=uncultured Roseobacter sp. TaxID=114847 RepID=UPI0026183E31|nr:GNAT family N-acetyltransferase [uncultured Roseobacter sp.]
MIDSATQISNDRLRSAMNLAFSDYPVPMRLEADAFDLMMRSRGLNKGLSQVAILDGKVAAFWLMGARGSHAYLISSGTLPQFRRGGLSRMIGRSVIGDLKSKAFDTLQSEVLENNPAARALYGALGFVETRTLACYTRPMQAQEATPNDLTICEISSIASFASPFWDSKPSWQNDIPSLIDAGNHATCFAIQDTSGLVAYAAFVRAQSSLAQIAVRQDMRRKNLATQLLTYGQNTLNIDNLRAINVDRANIGLNTFLCGVGARLTLSQKELRLSF